MFKSDNNTYTRYNVALVFTVDTWYKLYLYFPLKKHTINIGTKYIYRVDDQAQ